LCVCVSHSDNATTGSARAQAAAAALEAQHQKALAAETERLEGVLRDKAAVPGCSVRVAVRWWAESFQ